jgi:hypothetical protein
MVEKVNVEKVDCPCLGTINYVQELMDEISITCAIISSST